MGEVVPLRPATSDPAPGRWCSACGAARDASAACLVCGATAWQSWPPNSGFGTAGGGFFVRLRP